VVYEQAVTVSLPMQAAFTGGSWSDAGHVDAP
jgi:hypothetical protein